MILVIGASGYMGRNLYIRFLEEGRSVIGTFYKNPTKKLLYFNAQNTRINDLTTALGDVTHAVILSAAHASIDDSLKYWDISHQTNVLGVKRIIDDCVSNSIVPIYISSDAVFDGVSGSYNESDAKRPVNKYGIMKALVEDYIISRTDNYIILRMGKVFGSDISDDTLVSNLVRAILKGEAVRCAIDQTITPVHIGDLYTHLRLLINERMTGIFHIASLHPVTPYGIAESIKTIYCCDDVIVKGCEINKLNLPERRPVRTDLNDLKIRSIFGVKKYNICHYIKLIVDGDRTV